MSHNVIHAHGPGAAFVVISPKSGNAAQELTRDQHAAYSAAVDLVKLGDIDEAEKILKSAFSNVIVERGK